MRNYKLSDLTIVSARESGREGMYRPTSFLRFSLDGNLEQLWWSDAGDCVWEEVPFGNLSPKEVAMAPADRGLDRG